MLLRHVAALDGPARVRVRLGLRPDYGRQAMRDLHLGDDGCWRGRLGDGAFCWSGATGARVEQRDGHDELHLELALQPGQTHDLVLALTTAGSTDTPDATTAWAAVQDGWRRRLPEPARLGHAARDVRHAHAVLHGLTSASGAMVAAATLAGDRAQTRCPENRVGLLAAATVLGVPGAAAEPGAPVPQRAEPADELRLSSHRPRAERACRPAPASLGRALHPQVLLHPLRAQRRPTAVLGQSIRQRERR